MTEKWKMRPNERLAFMGLDYCKTSLKGYIETLERRITIADRIAMRLARTAVTYLERAIVAVSQTVEHDELEYLVKNCRGYEIVIRERRVTKDPSWMYVKISDLEVVLKHAVHDDCATCLKTPGEMRSCELRRAMQFMTNEPLNDFGCGYVAGVVVKKEDAGHA